MKAKYIGCNDYAVRWGSNADPRIYLEMGKEYEIDRIEEHSWHTKIFLKELPTMPFNSVCFEIDGLFKH